MYPKVMIQVTCAGLEIESRVPGCDRKHVDPIRPTLATNANLRAFNPRGLLDKLCTSAKKPDRESMVNFTNDRPGG